MCVLRPLPGSIFPRHKQLLWGYTGVFWQPLGHGSQGYMCPGKEPGPQTGAGDMRNLNGWSQKQQQGRKGTHPNTDFQLKNVKIFCIAMSNIYIYVCFIETFTRTLYFPEHYISWGTLAIQSFHFWWKQKGNDHDFSGSESLIFYCPSCIYKQVNREKFLLSCFPLSYVTALLVAPCRWVQSTSWPWHHATENRLMRQRKQGSLFCREAGSDHLVVVKTDHTELFCFVRDEFHSVTACLSDIL